MGIFDVDDNKLRAAWQMAWSEAKGGFVDPRKYPHLDNAIFLYAKEHNCSYDEAMIFAKTGEKTGRLGK